VTTQPRNGSNLAGVTHIRKTIEFTDKWLAKELRPGDLFRNEIVEALKWVFLGFFSWFVSPHEGPRGDRTTLETTRFHRLDGAFTISLLKSSRGLNFIFNLSLANHSSLNSIVFLT